MVNPQIAAVRFRITREWVRLSRPPAAVSRRPRSYLTGGAARTIRRRAGRLRVRVRVRKTGATVRARAARQQHDGAGNQYGVVASGPERVPAGSVSGVHLPGQGPAGHVKKGRPRWHAGDANPQHRPGPSRSPLRPGRCTRMWEARRGRQWPTGPANGVRRSRRGARRVVADVAHPLSGGHQQATRCKGGSHDLGVGGNAYAFTVDRVHVVAQA